MKFADRIEKSTKKEVKFEGIHKRRKYKVLHCNLDKTVMAEQVVDLTNLRTLDEIRKAFETLKCNEDKTDEELENLLSSHRLLN